MSDPEDEIAAVLRECEETLRTLAIQGRLTGNALGAFKNLAAQVRRELDRRKQGDRRQTFRESVDRRLPDTEPATADRQTSSRAAPLREYDSSGSKR